MAQLSMSFNDAAIVTVGRNDYRIHFWDMNESEALNRMKISSLSEKSVQRWLRKKYVFCIIVMLNNMPETRQQRHCEENKKSKKYLNSTLKIPKNPDWYGGLSEEEQNKRKYARNWHWILSEEKKQKLKEYRK